MPDQGSLEDRATSLSHRVLQTVRSHVQPGSLPLLLVAASLLYALNGLAVDSRVIGMLVEVPRAGLMFAGLYVLSANRALLWVGALVAGMVLALEGRWLAFDPWVSRALVDSITTGFILLLLAVVLNEIFRSTTTERDAVIGALCGFLLILTAFTRLHALLEALYPGSYHADGPPLAERSDVALTALFQYFSTITVTTVGYGDIVPVTPGARLATGLEAIAGQLYLAVVIATLVGRMAARRD